jgi:small subunit ribosomal protein S11
MADQPKAAKPAKEEAVTTDATAVSTAPIPDGATSAPTPTPKASSSKKKKSKRSVPSGQVHILATFNNTIVTFSDTSGNVLAASSAGACGFRGSKKGTAYAAQVAAERAGQTVKQQYGLSRADVLVKGIGLGRDAAIRALAGMDILVENIKDVTGVPHGGVRPRKARRV